MFFLINNDIEFHPADSKLISHTNPSLSVTLTVPAGRCLELLLSNSPEIIERNKFMEYVWVKHGMIVTMNTLYKNISMIRRGMHSVSNKNCVYIKTISREGFQFNSRVLIEKKFYKRNLFGSLVPLCLCRRIVLFSGSYRKRS